MKHIVFLLFITIALWTGTYFSVQAADPDYTIMVLPDTQYLVFTCSPQIINVMMNWIVTNKNADQGGVFTTNLKAVVGLGDITQQASSGEWTLAKGNSTSGFGILDNNQVLYVGSTGNHDYTEPTTDHTVLTNGFISPNGFASADYRQAHGYFGGAGTWGDKFDQANYYVKLQVGSRSILIFCIEFQPRAAVLTWAKGIHDANPGSECIMSTHSFLAQNGQFTRFSSESGNTGTNNDNSGFGLKTAQGTSDASFNSGYAMWNTYLTSWSRLTMILNGHSIASEAHYLDTPNTYHYITTSLSSTSVRGQTVQGIFTNWQDLDWESGAGYPSWNAFTPDSAPKDNTDSPRYCADVGVHFRNGHVLILQFRPSIGTVEGYIIATSNGRWEPTFANRASHMSTTPVLLFSLPYSGVQVPATKFSFSR